MASGFDMQYFHKPMILARQSGCSAKVARDMGGSRIKE
jgi:hypothetical protein